MEVKSFKTESLPVIHLRPSKGWVSPGLREIAQYHELLYFLIWRDIKIRYKQTALGAAWALIQPLFTMLIFSLFFGRLAKVPSDGIPYPLFSYTALVPWIFFANGLSFGSNSVVKNANLVTKVYFPRIVMPVATVLSGVVDFVLAFAVLICMMFYYGVAPTLNIIWLPLLFLLALVSALGVSLWFSAMNVQFRDVGFVIPFLTQIWLFATPIAYPSSLLSGTWRSIYGINPMVGVVEGFRWALLGADTSPGPIVVISAVTALLILISGVFYFRHMEKNFADIV